MRLVNWAGRRIGRLVVDRRAENASDGETRWLCSCDCGGRLIVRADRLRKGRGRDLSCGCVQRGTPRRKDETGRRYGRLVVVRFAGQRNGTQGAMWECRCDCGRTTTVGGSELRLGHTRSCGKPGCRHRPAETRPDGHPLRRNAIRLLLANDWTQAQVADLLGLTRERIRQVANEADVVVVTPRRTGGRATKWRPEWDQLLGTESDLRVARRVGVHLTTVVKRRAKMAIPAWRGQVRVRWQSAWDRLLGTATDIALGKRFGVDEQVVRYHRRRLGIGKASRKQTKEN